MQAREWLHPVAAIRKRFQAWWQSRLPLRDTTTLTQRNVYILPTRPGLMLGLTVMTLLLASINYQLNLGYVLTFLLMGCAVVGIHVCHGTLRGLTMNLIAPDACFAGDNATIGINLVSPSRSIRYGIGLAVLGTQHWSWADVPAQGSTKVQVAFQPVQRGQYRVPPLTAETRYPLGTFRVWTVWRPAAQVLVYPKPEAHPPPLPPGEPRAGGAASLQRQHTGEFDGVRPYRRGDPLKLVVWKKAAKADELVSRDAQQVPRFELWLDLAQAGSGHAGQPEQSLSRLCAWVLMAERQGLHYGLRLHGLEIAPGSGEAHKRHCLQALALF
ncbi:DUF58 domain-containing protein [Rhodoferax aquaticus]|nr:DUF58 domain-containing protein [Rhodoferax aquaticus]